MILVTAPRKGEVMEMVTRLMPLTGNFSLLLMVITVKIIAINRATPTKINSLLENIKSVNDYFSQDIDIIEDFSAAQSNR
jgi:hypothetical protein